MKKSISFILALIISLSLFGCAGQTANGGVKQSPDKYTWYVRNYVGQNAATIGRPGVGNYLRDEYGAGEVYLILQATSGEYIDVDDEESLKMWKVVDQSVAPNTEFKYTFRVNSEGVEIDYSVEHQSLEEIILYVERVSN